MLRKRKIKKVETEYQKRFPKSVVVLGVWFDICWENFSEPNQYGECDEGQQEIIISPKQNEQQALHTLLHEYIHAALAVGGINEMMTEELEEAVTKCLTSALFPLTDIKKAEIKEKKK